jgi:hypothetical protein
MHGHLSCSAVVPVVVQVPLAVLPLAGMLLLGTPPALSSPTLAQGPNAPGSPRQDCPADNRGIASMLAPP